MSKKVIKTKKKKDPKGSGVNHPFGAVHPLTEGQQKVIKQVTELLLGRRQGLDIKVSIENNRYFNWKDVVWSCAVGIIIGVIIAHL